MKKEVQIAVMLMSISAFGASSALAHGDPEEKACKKALGQWFRSNKVKLSADKECHDKVVKKYHTNLIQCLDSDSHSDEPAQQRYKTCKAEMYELDEMEGGKQAPTYYNPGEDKKASGVKAY